MSSETRGIFGRGGLLAKIQAEEQHSSDKIPANPAHQQRNEKANLPEQQESCESVDKLKNEAQKLSLTSEGNRPVPFVPLKDLPPMEAAFSIEKIQHAIFSRLGPVDLFRCRLVSSSWLRMATAKYKLLKWNKNAIWIQHDLQEKKSNLSVRARRRNVRLKNLTDTLDGLGSHTFPCSASMDLKMTIAPNDFFTFFDHYGFIVNSLNVKFQTEEKGKCFVYRLDSFLEFLMKLLTEQMPNLETLKVEFEENPKVEGEIDEPMLVSIKYASYFSGKQNQNLRTIEFGKGTPFEIIEAVCILAPKVERLDFGDMRFFVKYKHRLGLLKKLNFMPSSDPREQEQVVDAIKAIFTSEAKVDLTWLSVSFSHVDKQPEVWSDLAARVTEIFDKCCHSLEELVLFPCYFEPRTVLPRMPKVKLLNLFFNYVHPAGLELLPKGTSLRTTFPNLHSIDLEHVPDVRRFMLLCKKERVKSVKSIDAYNSNVSEKILQKYFPNADITWEEGFPIL